MVARRNLKLVKSGDKLPPGAAAYKRARTTKRETKRAERQSERRRLKVPQQLLMALQAAIGQRERPPFKNPFTLPAFPPAVVDTPKADGMAMDDVNSGLGANCDWTAAAWHGQQAMYQEGLVFPGYVYLAELTQRPEYRVVAECISTEMTRKWIKVKSTSDDGDDEGANDRVKELDKELQRLRLQHWFQKAAEVDCFFGRSHLYIDICDPTEKNPNKTAFDKKELLTSIGTGKDAISRAKIGKGFLRRLKVVEPIWVYPTNYDASNPLSTDWYEPDVWYVMGTRIHKSRLLRFVGREVPDILKPAYAFGGIAMSQLLKPYVDNWLRTRQSVADIVNAFSTFVLSTDLSSLLTETGDDLMRRLELFITTRNNKGVMAIDKDTEAFQNVSAPLGSLDSIQAQTQEHMAAIARIPLVKLLGIQPAGLNASSEGEIRAFYDFIHAFQEHLFRSRLDPIFHMAQLSLWGDIDEDLTYEFEPLWELDEAALAGVQKTKSDMHNANVQGGLISPEEARRAIAADPDSPYQGIDVKDIPEPPAQPGAEGEGGDPIAGGPEGGGEQPGGGNGGAAPAIAGQSGGLGGGQGDDAEIGEAGIPRQLPDNLGGREGAAAQAAGGSFTDGRAAGRLGRGSRVVGVSIIGGKRVALVELADDDDDFAAAEGVEPLDDEFDPDSDGDPNSAPGFGFQREEDDEPGPQSKPQLGYPKGYPRQGEGAARRFYERQRLGSGEADSESDESSAEAQGRDSMAHDKAPPAKGGGFAGDAALMFTPEARAARWIMALDRRLTTQWNEQEHPRGPDGKFVEYSIGPGLAKQATKLGFVNARTDKEGKIRLEHKNGAVLIVEPAGKDVPSQKYSFYMPGKDPIRDVTGQSGRSFAQKIAPFLIGEDPFKPPPPGAPPPGQLPPPPPKAKEPPKPKKETRDQAIARGLGEMKIETSHGLDPTKAARIAKLVAQTAADLGMHDMTKITITGETYEFELNGRKCKAGGTHNSMTRELKIYGNDITETGWAVKSLAAHEIMHDKWAYAKNEVNKERIAGLAAGDLEYRYSTQAQRANKSLTAASQSSKPRKNDKPGAYMLKAGVPASKYPNLSKLNAALYDVPPYVFEVTDGITNYSQEYWVGYKAGTSSFDTAVNETLAEMSGQQYQHTPDATINPSGKLLRDMTSEEKSDYLNAMAQARLDVPNTFKPQKGKAKRLASAPNRDDPRFGLNKFANNAKRVEQSRKAWIKLFDVVEEIYGKRKAV